jgi:uncharacterized protein DUF4270
MSNKIMTSFKYIGIGVISLLGIISCEKDLEDIAVDLVGEKPFKVGDSLIEIIAYNDNLDSSRVDNNSNKRPIYLLGVNQDMDFGYLKSTVISQLFLPATGVDFGDNAVIDLVVLDIPYFATRDGEQDAIDPETGDPILDEDNNPIQVPNFKLDSIYGNKSLEYNITVNELGTFLNTLDPLNPTKTKTYYSNRNYELKDQIFSGNFIPNRNDTVLYVNREQVIIGEDDDGNPIHDIDTVKANDLNPSMKFNLDNAFFKERFIDHLNSSDFENNDNFVTYFRGLYIDANGADGALMNIQGSDASVTIYYTNDEIKDEAENEDLNNNGVTGEQGVLVKSKQIMRFNFGGVRTGQYFRDYGGTPIYNALMNPDKVNGEQKLYIQGASGSQVILDLLSEENLEFLRNQNWLINEANLTIYIDGDQSKIPQQLFLYNYEYNSLLSDLISPRFGPDIFGGKLEYDSEGKPERYKFRITKYISDVLKSNDPNKISKLALRNHLITDLPDFTFLDTIASDFNWIPKGVILHGNLPKSNDKRIKLEIFYSRNNE